VSVAVGHTLPYGENLARTVIRRLVARDAAAGIDIVIEPGASIQSCRIHRNPETGSHVEVYAVEFEAGERTLWCPLVQFQARTEAVDSDVVTQSPAAETSVLA
jgi:hypothetical protein